MTGSDQVNVGNNVPHYTSEKVNVVNNALRWESLGPSRRRSVMASARGAFAHFEQPPAVRHSERFGSKKVQG